MEKVSNVACASGYSVVSTFVVNEPGCKVVTFKASFCTWEQTVSCMEQKYTLGACLQEKKQLYAQQSPSGGFTPGEIRSLGMNSPNFSCLLHPHSKEAALYSQFVLQETTGQLLKLWQS